MRGRVLSLYTLTFFGFTPFGNLLVGALGQALGLSIALIIMAVITLVSSIVIFWRTPAAAQAAVADGLPVSPLRYRAP